MAVAGEKNIFAHLPTNTRVWPSRRYQDLYRRSLEDPEGFWAEQARKLDWFKTWDKVLDWNLPYANWFAGGKLNACFECVDRHIKTWKKSKVAIYWEGERGETRVLSYSNLFHDVNRFASVLKGLGISKGDRVALYLPMIPELPAFMLACARIGATHTVIFSGFSAKAIAERVNNVQAKIIITADGGYRRGNIIPLKEITDEAVKLCPSVEKVLVVKRTGENVPWTDEKDIWLASILEKAESFVPPEPLDSNHPLYILYTSGTTGKPKGIVHGTGGYLVFVQSAYEWVFDVRDDSIFWSTADIGWVTGHSFTVYAPLLHGDTMVLYEGAPDYPGVDRWWEIIEKYGVTTFYTSPTAIRMFMRSGNEGPGKHDLSSLQLLGSVGEAINPEAWEWFYKNIGHERCPIVDTWWQTETGGIMVSPTPGIETIPLKPGSATFPLPGIDARIVDANGQELVPGETGYLIIKKPWPGMLLGIFGDPQRYQEAYWTRFPGSYYAGDFAMRDQDNYLWFLGRADEVLKISGHRIGTTEIEDAIMEHRAVAEVAAAGKPDELKGEALVLFVTLKSGTTQTPELKKEIIEQLRVSIGPFVIPDEVYFVNSMPKTRSGKIMRRVLKAIATGQSLGDLSTLESDASVEEVKNAYESLKQAHH